MKETCFNFGIEEIWWANYKTLKHGESISASGLQNYLAYKNKLDEQCKILNTSKPYEQNSVYSLHKFLKCIGNIKHAKARNRIRSENLKNTATRIFNIEIS